MCVGEILGKEDVNRGEMEWREEGRGRERRSKGKGILREEGGRKGGGPVGVTRVEDQRREAGLQKEGWALLWWTANGDW